MAARRARILTSGIGNKPSEVGQTKREVGNKFAHFNSTNIVIEPISFNS